MRERVWYKNYEAMQFLIDRGIDMTIHDYRWHATAEGWARVAAKDDKLRLLVQSSDPSDMNRADGNAPGPVAMR